MGVDVLDEFQFSISWADHQNLAGAFKCLSDVVVIFLIFIRFARTRFAAFNVQVLMRISRKNDLFFDLLRAKVHDMSFGMVKPDNGVVVRHELLSV